MIYYRIESQHGIKTFIFNSDWNILSPYIILSTDREAVEGSMAMEVQVNSGGGGVICPKCGRRAELLIETYSPSNDGMRRVTYVYRCMACKWRMELETLYVVKRDGKILVLRQGKA